jgi:hypothetical protein
MYDVLKHVNDMELGMEKARPYIANDIITQTNTCSSLLQEGEPFSIHQFLMDIGIPSHCIEEMTSILVQHGIVDIDALQFLTKEQCTNFGLKLGLRVLLKRGIVMLKYKLYRDNMVS